MLVILTRGTAASTHSVRSSTWRVCVPRRRVASWPGSSRWLVAYAHTTNGLANRLAGLRASWALASQSGRQLSIRWFANGQEGIYLQPARQDVRWTDTGAPGVLNAADGSVADVWGATILSSRPNAFTLPPGSKEVVENWDDGGKQLDRRAGRRVCVRALRDPFPMNTRHRDDVNHFLAHATRSPESVMVTSNLFYDVTQPMRRQADLVHMAHAQYRSLFKPTAAFRDLACRHLRQLGLVLGQPWIGLQLRRKVQDVGSNSSTSERADKADPPLEVEEKRIVRQAVACAMKVRTSLCAKEPSTCRAPIFLTSSSPRTLHLAARIVGADARFATDDSFTQHSSAAAASSYLPALLEFATLSASRVVIGTAGSSFALEAANMANTTAVVKDLYPLYPVEHELREAAIQGKCASGVGEALPPVGDSILLPRGSC